jgi:hypothetical protein
MFTINVITYFFIYLSFLPYNLNWITKLLDVGFMELSKGEHVLTIVMLTKKDIFGN